MTFCCMTWTTMTDLRSFIGLVNQLAEFRPVKSATAQTLHLLMSPLDTGPRKGFSANQEVVILCRTLQFLLYLIYPFPPSFTSLQGRIRSFAGPYSFLCPCKTPDPLIPAQWRQPYNSIWIIKVAGKLFLVTVDRLLDRPMVVPCRG